MNRAVARIFALLLLAPLCVSGWSERLQARLFDQSDGLGNLSAGAMAQDADGRLWVATENGLFRYDGSQFKEFGRADGLSDPSVYTLLLDHTGTLWAGTHNGLFRFDGVRFHDLPFEGRSLRISMNSVLTSGASGELVAQTPVAMLSVVRDGASGVWTAMRYEQRHHGLAKIVDTGGVLLDRANVLWVGCDGKICRYDGTATRVLGPAEGVPNDVYCSLFQAKDGRIWVRGRRHILTLGAEDRRAEDVTGSLAAGAIVTVARRFAEDSFGNILSPTAKGFATWDGKQWTETLATSKGPIEGAAEVFVDREGAVWIATDGAGLLESLGYKQWRNYGTAEGLANPAVMAIAMDTTGRMWFGHVLGTNLLLPSGAVVETPLAPEKDAAAIVSLAATPDGGMWASTILGRLFHVRSTGEVDRRISVDGFIQSIRLDEAGRLWIGTTNGLYIMDADTAHAHVPRQVVSPLLAGATVGEMAFAGDGSTWLATDRGLIHLRARGNAVERVTVDGTNPSLRTLALDPDGTLWLAGLMPGLIHVRVDGNAARVIEAHTRPELASDLVVFVGRDARGRLWIGTDHGVNLLRDGKISRITEEDGLIGNVCADRSFLAQPDGSVWFGTSLGAAHLIAPETVITRPDFRVSIQSGLYGGAEMAAGEGRRWDAKPAELHFSALTFRDSKAIVYHYRLEGLEGSETATTMPVVRYGKLPPGSYVLHVVAEDPGHAIFSKPTTFAFTLIPPWWRSHLFFGWLGLLSLGLLRLLWLWRHVALLARQKRLEKMVDERTAEIARMAMRDDLTGLMNRRAILAALRAEFAARRSGMEVCVAILDLDHFKQINDTHGHLAGDEVLRSAGERLASAVRSSDAVGRYGGEEFLVIFREARPTFGLERCEVLRQTLCAEPIRFEGKDLLVTCSIGFAWSDKKTDPVSQLLANADRALYSAKKHGRNRVEYTTLDGGVEASLAIAS